MDSIDELALAAQGIPVWVFSAGSSPRHRFPRNCSLRTPLARI